MSNKILNIDVACFSHETKKGSAVSALFISAKSKLTMIFTRYLLLAIISAFCLSERIAWLGSPRFSNEWTGVVAGHLTSAIYCWRYWPKTTPKQMRKLRLEIKAFGSWVNIATRFSSPPTSNDVKTNKVLLSRNRRGRLMCSEVGFTVPKYIPTGKYEIRLKMKNAHLFFDRVYQRRLLSVWNSDFIYSEPE
jgi:hypothetical protein